jgi:hypothetical protein
MTCPPTTMDVSTHSLRYTRKHCMYESIIVHKFDKSFEIMRLTKACGFSVMHCKTSIGLVSSMHASFTWFWIKIRTKKLNTSLRILKLQAINIGFSYFKHFRKNKTRLETEIVQVIRKQAKFNSWLMITCPKCIKSTF